MQGDSPEAATDSSGGSGAERYQFDQYNEIAAETGLGYTIVVEPGTVNVDQRLVVPE